MSYQYTAFDDVALPLYNHEQNHDLMASESTLLDSIGGAYDWHGTDRRKGRKQLINLKGIYFGATTYLVDETGDKLVDESDDYLIAGDSQQMLQAQITALREKKGVKGTLWRNRLDDSTLEWKTARLLQVGWPRKWDDHAVLAEVTCQFETLMEFWHAATATTTSGSATSGVALPLLVEVTGEQVDDATITITRTSGTITAVSLTCAELGISLAWTGTMGAGDVLTIDCGAQTVKENTTDAYSGFSLSGHTAAGWLPIPQGNYVFYATVTGGNATVAIQHYNQYP